MENLLKARETLLSALIKTNEKYHNNDPDIYSKIIEPIIKDVDNFYLSLADEIGKVTYAKDRADKFNEKKRIKTSFRRFLRRQLDINSRKYPDDWLNRFGCEVLSFLPFDVASRIKILSGEDIVKFYTKTFINTCMTGKGNAEKIAFYAINKDKVALAVLDNFIRAFIWTTDDGTKVFDRIYPSGNSDAEILFRKWASDNGCRLRSNPSGLVPVSEAVGIDGGIVLNVTVNKCAKYPYLDTFRFGRFDKDVLLLSNSPIEKEYIFTRANGGYNNFVICQVCNKVSVKNYLRIDNKYVCENCVITLYHRCCYCNRFFSKNEMNEAQKRVFSNTRYLYCKNCISSVW